MSPKANSAIAVIGIDIGKNSFHLVGQDKRGGIMLRQKWSRDRRKHDWRTCRRV
jgi:transposase